MTKVTAEFSGIFFYPEEIKCFLKQFRFPDIVETPYVILTKKPKYINSNLLGLRVYAEPLAYGYSRKSESMLVSLYTVNQQVKCEIERCQRDFFPMLLSEDKNSNTSLPFFRYGPLPTDSKHVFHGVYGYFIDNHIITC